MRLIFAGTRGEIDARTPRHRRHSALVVIHRGRRVMVDCGADWHGHIAPLRPEAIVLTHAHPDHAQGLADGAPCPVYATRATWRLIERFPIRVRHQIVPRQQRRILGITFEAFPVEHSILYPAVSYRISAGGVAVHYAPDLVTIRDRRAALRRIRLYVGDGASLTRPLVRRRGRRLIGHVPVRTQITWCAGAAVPRALFTHCGTGIVAGDERNLDTRVRDWGRGYGVESALAHDGLVVDLR
jgi:phosphoribosyl 1,2-cyclic phosphodiesterase